MEVYAHLRILISLILGLGITRILGGLSRMVQVPSFKPGATAHIVWSLAVLLNAVHFWWFEFALRDVPVWYFGAYLVVLFYAFLQFLLASLLFPDVMGEHDRHEDYFMARRPWFFGIFALTFILDTGDTAIKGKAYLASLGPEYWVRIGIACAVALLAVRARSPKVVAGLGIFWLVYDASWIARIYDVLG